VGQRLGIYDPGDLDHGAIDAVLRGLEERSDPDACFEALKRLVAYWHGPMSPADGMKADELKREMPRALRRWFEYAGRRPGILSGQNFLLGPAEIEDVEDDPRLIVFYVECQRCYEWATARTGEDPDVLGRNDSREPWQSEGTTVSQFLIQVCLFEAVFLAPYGATHSWIDEAVVTRLMAHLKPLPFAPWRWLESSRFYHGQGAFAFISGNGEDSGRRGASVWLAAKTEASLRFLDAFPDVEWDTRSF